MAVNKIELTTLAQEDCEYCNGTGFVTDYVDYGSTKVPLETICECVLEDDEDE